MARIGKHLVADDPQLAESLHLWYKRCRGDEPGEAPGVPAWLLGSVLAATVLCVLVALSVAGSP